MKLKLRVWMAGVAVATLLGACEGVAVPGLGEAAGCKTVYVFRPTGGGNGVVQGVQKCGDTLPRDRLMASTLTAQAKPEAGQAGEAPKASGRAVSTAALATAPVYAPEKAYGGANDMIENADMAAFMARVHQDFAEQKNSGAWGFAVIDTLASGDTAHAQDVLDAMASKAASDHLSANHLRPWVLAFPGRNDVAQREMAQLRRLFPPMTLLAHRALLAEGLGDTEGALKIYDDAPDEFDAPKPEDAAQPNYLRRAIDFNSQRMLALRQAELLRGLNRDPEAVTLLTRLSAATPDDPYVADRLEKAKAAQDRRPPRTLNQAMALAVSDEADIVEERQAIMGMMVNRGGRIPFNHLLSSLRQSALLLDPDNGDIRMQEVNALYQGGHFEAALRLAQIGNPRPAQGAALASTAGLAALELGSPQTLEAMTDRALRVDSSPEAKLAAASALTNASLTDRAIRLIDQALREGLSAERKTFALMAKGQARFQGGDIAGAVAEARAARVADDDEDTQQFLASMLVKSPQRPEGLQIMREMLAKSPNNTSMMNNFGYSLIDNHANDAELDEGFRLLKEASRLSPDEPNLLDSLGWSYYLYGDFREANRFIEMALEAYAPFDHWELLDHMGDVKWRLDEKDAAKKFWADAAAARPPKHELARIQAKVKDGLLTPAPQRRDTPDVPRNRIRRDTNDI